MPPSEQYPVPVRMKIEQTSRLRKYLKQYFVLSFFICYFDNTLNTESLISRFVGSYNKL